MKFKNCIYYAIILLLFQSCETKNSKDNLLTFTVKSLPGTEITGIVDSGEDRDIVYVTRIRLFSNWANGWTEGSFEASGKYYIETFGSEINLTEIDPIEIWDINSGEIRYFDKYYRNDDGEWKVKNRIDRLREVVSILKKNSDLPEKMEKSSEVYSYLFPELDEGRNLFKDIKWNEEYTKETFPENIWELRDSGTIYRDVTESPDILVTLYNLDSFIKDNKTGRKK